MKKILLVLAAGCLLIGCRSKLDLDNLDTSAEVKVGLTLPVGNLRMTLLDMVGDVEGLYVDNGILTWKFDTTTARDYHQLDLADYLSTTTEDLKIYDQIPAEVAPYLNGLIPTPKDIDLWFDFDVNLPLDGINEDKTGQRERLDSAYITSANFYSIVNPIDLPFEWGWMDSIVLDLGDRFRYPSPDNKVIIYAKKSGGISYDFGDSIPITLDAFVLDMMKKPLPEGSKAEEYYHNVYDTCSFKMHIKVTIPKDRYVSVKPTSEFQYELGARFLNYTAIWGMFEPSEQMSGNDVIDMSDTWKSFDFMTKATIPFAEPKLDTKIITQIAGAFYLDKSTIFTLDDKNDTTYALFDGSRYLNKFFSSSEYLPLSSAIGDSTTNMGLLFDNKYGEIHRMFRKTPQKLGYSFKVFFNESVTPQLRITPNTHIRIRSTLTLPFVFNQGVWIEYPDSSEVALSQFSIDSIQASTNVIDTIKAASVKLIMQAESLIPMGLKLAMSCYDENDNLVMDPIDQSKPFYLFDRDTILITPPSDFSVQTGTADVWLPTTPGKTQLIASMTKDQLDVFPKIKKIRYKAVLDDKALDDEYTKGMKNIRLLGESDVKIQIGLTGNLEAVLNFDKK